MNKLIKIAMDIWDNSIKSVDPYYAVKDKITLTDDWMEINKEKIDIKKYNRIFFIAFGKASEKMSEALCEILGENISSGIIINPYNPASETEKKNIRYIQAGHPSPNENSIQAGQQVLELADEIKKDDLVFILISGGGSALLSKPAEGISLDEKQKVNKLLLECGADIYEINTVRKHLSSIKGGWLAKHLYPARVYSIILSDVTGDDLSTIASGPVVPDYTTFAMAYDILRKYGLSEAVPVTVLNYIKEGMNANRPETPSDERLFANVKNILAGSNIIVLETASREAAKHNFNPLIITSALKGESREAAKSLTSVIKEVVSSDKPVKVPACIIMGGETTVTLKGSGKGGRNQEFVLSCLLELRKCGMKNKFVILSAGSDGIDGPTDAAGAVIDNDTLEILSSPRLLAAADEALRNNDSYNFFKGIDSLVITGPTGTNAGDICISLIV